LLLEENGIGAMFDDVLIKSVAICAILDNEVAFG
jgi:hypothetical protein